MNPIKNKKELLDIMAKINETKRRIKTVSKLKIGSLKNKWD